MTDIKLKAYRFSEEEMSKMIWLKKLFEKNEYNVYFYRNCFDFLL